MKKPYTYKVIWFSVGESFDDDSVYLSNSYWYDPEYHLNQYLELLDNNSCFVDGYPNGDEFLVMNVVSGEVSKYVVHTEWEPQFVVEGD